MVYRTLFWKEAVKLFIAIGVCELAGLAGSFFTIASIPTWYASLAKPLLNPPSWIFGPVWTILYLIMGISAFLVWRQGVWRREIKWALAIFTIQLFLNAIWSPIFFGARNISLALVDIGLLWFAILLTMIFFFRISKIAGWLLVPYLAWVSFAFYLNYAIWTLN